MLPDDRKGCIGSSSGRCAHGRLDVQVDFGGGDEQVS